MKPDALKKYLEGFAIEKPKVEKEQRIKLTKDEAKEQKEKKVKREKKVKKEKKSSKKADEPASDDPITAPEKDEL